MNTTNPMARFRLWVLAWFLMSLGAATATPIFQPKMLDVVCTTSGALKFFALTDEGAIESDADTQNCPLCLVGGVPPTDAYSLPPATPAVAPLPCLRSFPRAVAATAAPPPARAPPFFLSQS
ncbi:MULTISPECIES: hypothetical protein [unclassified Acidovorax]|jgi:hypothetical protein|uniref:hypothetical protein n=2 Tax=Acidovorax TaxID=12916 RepID=UPI000BD66D77|nr:MULTISPECIES: hypothetical protein [unclassified Acidovorax]HQS20031.1 hypothetical protein [Acidovorax defluvii]OYY29516.1 MAG: hypothetical protein B7Y64_02495 [Acidovorax sp. 35-64-16]OYZ70524.1 MAG: hypothetical protein B7Y14_03785 [Acidovorax sp. 24-64-9]OZA71121.1 MAG: hypothetical protein B7X70_03895 [Acidovorax sp. 39-64-12]HQS61923.1 hypothetical protein [Acidovorax defluvii]